MKRACLLGLSAALLASAAHVRGESSAPAAAAQGATSAMAQPAATMPIDLPTALRLAGSNTLDVQIAREKVTEARASEATARERFFPWIAPSVVVRRHEDNIQAVNGPIINADKQSLSAGVAVNARMDLGETYYAALAARQQVQVSEAVLAGRQRLATLQAAAGYFQLARAHAAVVAAEDAAQIAGRHAEQIAATTSAGITFKGDASRVEAAHERARLTVERLRAEQRIAAARLAELLHLDPAVELTPADADVVPLSLPNISDDLGDLVSRALAARPELTEAQARLNIAHTERRGATVGPLVPTLGAQAALSGLGGGEGSSSLTRSFNTSGDYELGLSWRIGPGGLFDRNRERQAVSRERQSELGLEQTRDAIRRDVVEQYARLHSLAAQIDLAKKTLEAADQTARLSRERRETGVSAVLEDLQAEDELAAARRDYLAILADYNVAQYALRYAAGY